MTGVDNAVADVIRWVDFYTGALDAGIAADRREEVLADIRDQIDWSRAEGRDEVAIARSLRRRALRGAAADVSWSLGAVWRTPAPVVEHPLRLLVSAMAVGFIVLGVVSLARRPIGDDLRPAMVLLAGVLVAFGALVLLGRRRTRALGALWVVGAAQIVLWDGIRYLAGSTTILAHVTGTESWMRSLLLADVGIILLCSAAAVWWATAEREARAR